MPLPSRFGSLASATMFLSGLLGSAASAQFFGHNRTIDFVPPLPFTGPDLRTPGLRGVGGDWDGDGLADIAVHYPHGCGYTGSSAVWLGGRLRIYSGFDSTLLHEWIGGGPIPPNCNAENVGMGADFADLDGDGHLDVLLGVPESSLGGLLNAGRVDAISGATGLLLYSILGEALGDNFGTVVVVAGDTSGNAVPDYLVAAPGADHPLQVNAGAVYLFEGLDGSLRHKFLGATPGELEGFWMAGLGDIDIDGVGDLAIARPRFNSWTGKVTLYSGLNVPAVIREHVGTQLGWRFGGGALFSPGDVDGDTVPDYVLSSAGWGVAFPSPGVVAPGESWLYSGLSGGLLTTFTGPPGTAFLGAVGDAVDDLDGDGANDLVLSASCSPLVVCGFGTLFIFSSATGAILQEIPSPITSGTISFGLGLRQVGDVDGDGRVDIAAGRHQGPLFVFTREIVSASPSPAPLGSTVVFDVEVPSQPFGTFHLYLAEAATTGIAVGTRSFPLDFGPVLLATAQDFSFGGMLDSSGKAQVSVAVPPDPALAGMTVYYAAATFDPTWPYGVRTIGNARTLALQ